MAGQTLADRARAAAEKNKQKATREKDAERKKYVRETKPKAAAAVGKHVGRRIAQSAMENIRVGTAKTRSSSNPTLIFRFDGVEFEYEAEYSIRVRKPCPSCGETVARNLYSSQSEKSLIEIGAFLNRETFDPYDHSCYETAKKALRQTADSYARHLNATGFDLLHYAATSID